MVAQVTALGLQRSSNSGLISRWAPDWIRLDSLGAELPFSEILQDWQVWAGSWACCLTAVHGLTAHGIEAGFRIAH
jgi:hypothetical protein